MEPARREVQRWREHPLLSGAVRAVVLAVPLLAGFGAGFVVSQVVPRPPGAAYFVLHLALVTVVSVVAATLADRVARKLLPLAALLNLSLLFPDRAPSRFKVALRSSNVRRLERQVQEARSAGLGGSEIEAAERVIELAASLSAHDRLTRGHSERVRAFTAMLAEELKLPADEVDRLHWAALLHDVGKLTVHRSILNNPGLPDAEDWEILRRHPEEGGRLVAPLAGWLGSCSLAVEQHHERFDGRGYPKGLSGEEICLAARMVAVADSFDVMTSTRSYKKALPMEAARAELTRCSGTQFDPAVVRAFLNIGLGRLRWAAGPISSLAQTPAFRPFEILTPFLGTVSRAAMGLLAFGGATVLAAADPPDVTPPAAFAAIDELPADPAPPEATAATTAPPEPAAAVPPPTPTADPADGPTARPAAPGVEADPPVPSPPSPSPDLVPLPAPAPEPAGPEAVPAPPEPDPPVFLDRTVSIDEDGSVRFNLLEGHPPGATIHVVDGPASGTVVVDPQTGELIYFPAADVTGADHFLYEVCVAGACRTGVVAISRTPVADAPVAGDDQGLTDEDESVDIDVLANDSDVDGDLQPGTLEVIEQPASGTAVVAGSGPPVIRFTPSPGASGPDSLRYRVCDGSALCATAVVSVAVAAVNDAPVAVADAATTDEDVAVTVDVSANDTDADGDTPVVVAAGPAAHGSVSVQSGGLVLYSPEADWSGTDSFPYTTGDPAGATAGATVTVTVGAVNDAPGFTPGGDVAALAGSTHSAPWASGVTPGPPDEAGQTVSFSVSVSDPGLFTSGPAVAADGTLTFVAGAAGGQATVTVTAVDSGGASSAPAAFAVTLTVGPAGGMVVSEFRMWGPGGDDLDDFVELYNAGPLPQPIGGWSVRISGPLGLLTSVTTIPGGVVLPSGGHYLLGGTAYSGADDQALTGDVERDGGIGLLDGSGVRVDQVGSADTFLPIFGMFREGGGLPNMSSGSDKSYERKAGGAGGNCVDTDVNTADFLSKNGFGNQNPQTSLAPAVVCGP